MKPERTPKLEPITLSRKCNQNCLFCAAYGGMPPHTEAEIAGIISRRSSHVIIGGWEPTMDARLERTVRRVRSSGTRNIALFTNAVRLSDPGYADRLIEAGVTLFNINFPAHTRELSDRLTQCPGAFEKRVSAIKHLLTRPDCTAVSLCFVVNTLNYKVLPAYAKFVSDNFNGVEHVALNMVCVSGRAQLNAALIPELKKIEPYLKAAAGTFMKRRVRCVIDNVPLCRMRGFEYASNTARQAVMDGARVNPGDKDCLYTERCGECTLKQLCAGMRRDYYDLKSAAELLRSRKSPGAIAEAIRSEKYDKNEERRTGPYGKGRERGGASQL